MNLVVSVTRPRPKILNSKLSLRPRLNAKNGVGLWPNQRCFNLELIKWKQDSSDNP
jgi:hypothetical protein